MTNKKSYENCPNRKLRLEGITDECFRCELTLSYSAGCEHKYYEKCAYTGDNFKKCKTFNRNRSCTGYMGCSAGAIQ